MRDDPCDDPKVAMLSQFQVNRHYTGVVPPDHVPMPRAALTRAVGDCLADIVAVHAGRVAVVEAGRTLTYVALDGEANAYAHALLAALGEGEEPVAVIMDLGDPVLPAPLGALKAGKVYAGLDPADPDARLAQLMARLQPRAIITAARHEARIRALLQPDQSMIVAETIIAAPRPDHPTVIRRRDARSGDLFYIRLDRAPQGHSARA